MKLSKTTLNKAARNNIELFLETNTWADSECERGRLELWIHQKNEDGEAYDEPQAIYRAKESGFFFVCGLNSRVSEDCPHWIESEQKLRDLIPCFAAQ